MSRVILLCALVAIAILALSACSSATTSESDVFVDPAVLAAFEESSEVKVLVSLKPPDIPEVQRTMELRSQDFAERLTRVLEDVDESDFEVLIESEQSGALTGMLTKDGLAVLREHSDVDGVVLSVSESLVPERVPAIGTLTGTISRLVEQIFEDHIVVEEITEPVTNGTVSIPELGVEQPIGPDGSFSFTSLELTGVPMLLSLEVAAPGYRTTTWAKYLIMYGSLGPNFAPRVELGTEPELIDMCQYLLARTPVRKSAVQELHRELCRELTD